MKSEEAAGKSYFENEDKAVVLMLKLALQS